MKKQRATKKHFKLIVCITFLGISIILSAVLIYQNLTGKPQTFSFKAAIVDQLGYSSPNEYFIQNLTNLLSKAGFEVKYYPSEEVTVNFYKQLVKENFGIIILRVHSGSRNDTNVIDFFTSEPYNENRHIEEAKKGYVSKGYIPEEDKYYFAVTPTLISAEATFYNSIIVAMGCSSLKHGYEGTAKTFIDRGAKVYIGWSNLVTANHSDKETIKFLRCFLLQNMTIKEAIDRCAPDPYLLSLSIESILRYYPPEAGNLKFDEISAQKALDWLLGTAAPVLLAEIISLSNTLQLTLIHFYYFLLRGCIFCRLVKTIIPSKPWKTNGQPASFSYFVYCTCMNRA